jgi:hypothetical protein
MWPPANMLRVRAVFPSIARRTRIYSIFLKQENINARFKKKKKGSFSV